MTTDPRVLRAERYAEIGAVIQRDAGLLIERWRERALHVQPKAPQLHREALLDHLPEFLAQLGQRLESRGHSENGPHTPSAHAHGQQRWEAGWSLSEMIRDYQLLRLVLLEYLDEALSRELDLREIMAVGLALDEAIAASVERYTAHRDEELGRLQSEHSAQQTLAQQQLMQWKHVFEHASWGVALANPADDILLAVNPAFARMHGYAGDELLGRPLTAVFAPESLTAFAEAVRRVQADGEHVYESIHVRKDGSRFAALTNVVALKDEAGNLRLRAANCQDISERKQLEESLRQQAEALQTSDRRKNEFLATLGHELRNPLAPLRNALEVLRLNGADPAVARQAQDIMDRQLHQLTRLVDDLLDVSRIAQGKLTLRKERLDLRNVLAQAVQMNTPLVASRGHRLTVHQPDEPLWVEADRARLIQVFVNLLNNAAKYTPSGGEIVLSATGGPHVEVRVRDNGVGIPPEMLTRIFDLFTQINDGIDRSAGGLGIGLTLVRRLVELHGGTVTARSAGVNQGSEFIVTFQTAPEPTPPAPASGARASASRHILIVEDNADSRESLAQLLRLLGHRVDSAPDGPTGIEAALRLRPEVALLDIGLPRLNGYEVAQRLRGELGDRIFLVALTGHSQPEDRQRALAVGFNAHLTKPIEMEQLGQLLDKRK
ncbi:MAG: response regulator [Planctomycetia bacterium]|nr:response regulator [Planctomycetia bacterium]